MPKIALTLTALAAVALLSSQPSQAYYDGQWCAVSSMGRGGAIERCDFRDFESCRMEIVSGNRGFCRQNSYWQGAAAASSPRKARKRARH